MSSSEADPGSLDAAGAVSAVSALDDVARRRLYDYVCAHDEGVGREQAAAALELSPHTARFHLDKLVQVGLLEVDYRRLTGRTGPGAGRPAKIYLRARGEVAVSLPPRHYDLVGRLLAAAVQRSLSGAPLEESLAREAHAAGARDGRASDRARPEHPRAELAVVAEELSERGYEPRPEPDGGLVLHNCPFDALVGEHPELVCGVNRDYVTGLVEGLGCCRTRAVLDPAPGRCCVRVSPAG